MRVIFSTLALSLVLAVVAPATNADASSIGKRDLSSILSEQGYAVRDFSDNMVAVVVGEYIVLVGVDGADGDISYITFLSGVTANDLGYEFLNNFNNEVKFGRAYIDRDGDVAIQMDRNAAGGITAENIESDFDVFLLLISKFLSDLESQTIA